MGCLTLLHGFSIKLYSGSHSPFHKLRVIVFMCFALDHNTKFEWMNMLPHLNVHVNQSVVSDHIYSNNLNVILINIMEKQELYISFTNLRQTRT